MVIAFKNVLKRMAEAKMQSPVDQDAILRQLDPRQRKTLSLFQQFEVVTSKQISELFGSKPRTSAQICKDWFESGFLEMVDSSNRGRKYRLSPQYEELLN
jgi:predicted HTH transcriptional regulator